MEQICEIAEREVVSAALEAGDLVDNFNTPNEDVDLWIKVYNDLPIKVSRFP